jgi:hypothetical protein
MNTKQELRAFLAARFKAAYQIGLRRDFAAAIGPALRGRSVDYLPLCDAAVRQDRAAEAAIDAMPVESDGRRAASAARKHRPGAPWSSRA